MNAIVVAVIVLLSEIAPLVQSSSSIARIIQALIEILPTVVKVAQDLVQPIKNIVASLQTNPATTEEQMRQLDELNAKVDAEFEAAAARVIAEDANGAT